MSDHPDDCPQCDEYARMKRAEVDPEEVARQAVDDAIRWCSTKEILEALERRGDLAHLTSEAGDSAWFEVSQ